MKLVPVIKRSTDRHTSGIGAPGYIASKLALISHIESPHPEATIATELSIELSKFTPLFSLRVLTWPAPSNPDCKKDERRKIGVYG